MIALIILVLLLFCYLFYPVRPTFIQVDERAEVIKAYREESDSLAKKQLISGDEKERLLLELDKKSAMRMLSIDSRQFTYRKSLFPVFFVSFFVIVGTLSYRFYMGEQKIYQWQKMEKLWYSDVLLGLFDEASVRNFVTENAEATVRYYCFLMQHRLLKHYKNNATALSNVAQCHLSQGRTTLAKVAVSRALQHDPNHAASIYVLAELEFLQNQVLSSSTREQLVHLFKTKTHSVDSLYLLMLDSYAQGAFKEAKRYVVQLRKIAHSYPSLKQSLDVIEPQIDAQLYMIENQNE